MGRGEEEQGWNSDGSVGNDEVRPCASRSAGSDQKNRPKCDLKTPEKWIGAARLCWVASPGSPVGRGDCAGVKQDGSIAQGELGGDRSNGSRGQGDWDGDRRKESRGPGEGSL